MTPPKPSARRLTALAQRAIDRAIDGGQHQVLIDEFGRTRILPLGVTPDHADTDALDAEIRGHLESDGDARH
ncbi:hypothetical protein [Brevundimonas sp. UBA7664]|uniref:hypothetical protein n=1 Tax=Brevundimonas sp. UBA7664 TaxID=1946141 RepID=UPI0025C1E2B5|nr:hypothetical protein [Brevundimonas sp. UBA7664]